MLPLHQAHWRSEGVSHRFQHISSLLSTPLPWLLCVFRFDYFRRYREAGPAPQPRFELGITDSESVVLPVTLKGNVSLPVTAWRPDAIRDRFHRTMNISWPMLAFARSMEHRAGIEPALSDWKSDVLPLNYRCNDVDKV